ncbi:MAG: alpha/beta hydrolase [bacterium]|nr:alpha/beta hydrolase [bacterium]
MREYNANINIKEQDSSSINDNDNTSAIIESISSPSAASEPKVVLKAEDIAFKVRKKVSDQNTETKQKNISFIHAQKQEFAISKAGLDSTPITKAEDIAFNTRINRPSKPLCTNNAIKKTSFFNGFEFHYNIKHNIKPKTAPILFLGGAFQNMISWKKYKDSFSKLASIILVDLPGTGEACILPHNYTLEFLASSLEDFLLNAIRIRKINILAVSYGTSVAYLFAKKNPNNIGSLALAGTMKKIPEEHKDIMHHSIKILKKKKINEFADVMVNALISKEKYVHKKKFATRVLRASILKMSDKEKIMYIENTMRLIQHKPIYFSAPSSIKTIVFTGEHDPFTKPKYCKEISKEFNNGVFTTIKNADHLFPLEQ